MTNKINIPENVRHIMATISANGGQVYMVGGCVRDICMDRKPHDYDLVTNLKPDAILSLFKDNAKSIDGKSFGVVKVDGIEIATYRKDIYNKAIHTKGADEVIYADTLAEDLGRRDFTINAMAMDIEGNIIDLFGGWEDIKNRIVRFVGDAGDRIQEDPCRILRACRFTGLFKDGKIDIASYAAIRNYNSAIQLVAKERIRMEILKILSCNDIMKPILYIKNLGLMEHIIKPLYYCYEVKQNKHHADDVFMHCLLSANAIVKKRQLLRFAMLLHDVGKPIAKKFNVETGDYNFLRHEDIGAKIAKDYLEEMKFSNAEINYICDIIEHHMFVVDFDTKKSAIRRLMRRLKYANIFDLVRSRIADRRGNRNKIGVTGRTKHLIRSIKEIARDDNAIKVTDLEIDGNYLTSIGLKPGPIFGDILNKCLEEVIE